MRIRKGLRAAVAIALCVSIASGCAKKDAATGGAASDEKAGVARMISVSAELDGQLDGHKDADIRKAGETLETTWASFEDEVKKKFPDLYVKTEKHLSPIAAGSKMSPIEYETLKKTNADLKSTLQELSDALAGKRQAVSEKKLNDSPELQAAAKSYNEYVQAQGKQLVALIGVLKQAIAAGDLKAAQTAYVKARLPYERIEPVIEAFEELDAVMDARVDDYKDENDPEFTGFHRLEHALFIQKSTKSAESFAARLLEDSKKLQSSIAATELSPADFVTGVGELMEEAQSTKITGEEERWSGATIPVIRGNVEGAQQIFSLVKAEMVKKDAALADRIAQSLQQMLQALDELSPEGDAWASYETIAQPKKVELKSKLEALADSMSRMPGTLGG